VKAWLAYAVAGLLVAVVGAGIASLLVDGEAARAIWFAAAVAWLVQMVAFAGLVLVRERTELFLIGWLLGLVLRFGAVLVTGLWLTRDPVLPVRPAMLGMVGFVFVLLVLEPMFLRRGLQTR
jgi:hypothetical protein